jgi:exodeoxyribonuclease V alpha subunit
MNPQAERSTQEVLAGFVERVTYHNPENGFCVLRAKARGHREMVTVVGHAASIAAGEWITASGEWVNDRTHGQQFKARATHFLMKTLPRVASEMALHVLAYNLTRAMNIMGIRPLMTAMRA